MTLGLVVSPQDEKIEIPAHVRIYKQWGKFQCSINIRRTKVSEDDKFGNGNVFCVVVNSNNEGRKSLSDFGKQYEVNMVKQNFHCEKISIPNPGTCNINVLCISMYYYLLC